MRRLGDSVVQQQQSARASGRSWYAETCTESTGELSHKCDTHCNCERDMTCDDLREPVQLAIVHTLEKQRMDVANLFGNNLSTVKRLTHS
jgi:hypothetical protein